MKLWSQDIKPNEPIPEYCAFGKYHPKSHVELSDNKSPHLAWDEIPDGTQSFVIICHDSDVPSQGDDVNQADRTVPADLPRVDFFHWVQIDLPTDMREVATGAFSDGITVKGKPGPEGPLGTRQGLNNYTQWFEGDTDMSGNYFGYDGPCPPWNDSIVHHYHFTLYALDCETCDVSGNFDGTAVLSAMEGHILAQAQLTATYKINPAATEL